MIKAAHISALFAEGAVAYQTRDTISADSLLPQEHQFLVRAVPKRVQEFAAGRACARAALSALGYPPVALPMNADRGPRWPAAVTGSITHTDDFCAAVVAPTARSAPWGWMRNWPRASNGSCGAGICTAQELEVLEAQDEAAALADATLIFSAKEAFYKCQHTLTGEWLGFADLNITIDAGQFTVQPTRTLQIASWLAPPLAWPLAA